eukprot:gnl/MRDRNA2_/MRDRNA2_148375_c0_seq1.p1 gnl/MRDRNA2_/MRDRNA2_148375_c0~~gnl/MRDRNA2_/MRDRNA2_148375_c0_seq1.p1  ORF type:complete len:283 (-),score=55.41 gnl/MRDRNA2_/MRDRNA2_148375_c0_seq1:556-1404(-)
MPSLVDLSLDSSYASYNSDESGKLVVKNTFISVESPKEGRMRRCNSGSDLSEAKTPSLSELKQWSDATSSIGDGSSVREGSGSGRHTPLSWADQEDSEDEEDAELIDALIQGQAECNRNFIPPPPTLDAMQLYEKLQGLTQGRSIPDKVLAELEQDPTIQQHIPLDANGNLSSLGSIPHGCDPVATKCKPCIFLYKKRCTKGEFCLHCHLPHSNFKAKRLRASKATRQRRAKMWAHSNEDPPASGSQGSQGGYSSGSSAQGSSNRSAPQNSSKPRVGTRISL